MESQWSVQVTQTQAPVNDCWGHTCDAVACAETSTGTTPAIAFKATKPSMCRVSKPHTIQHTTFPRSRVTCKPADGRGLCSAMPFRPGKIFDLRQSCSAHDLSCAAILGGVQVSAGKCNLAPTNQIP